LTGKRKARRRLVEAAAEDAEGRNSRPRRSRAKRIDYSAEDDIDFDFGEGPIVKIEEDSSDAKVVKR
jgi:hypothetical protein